MSTSQFVEFFRNMADELERLSAKIAIDEVLDADVETDDDNDFDITIPENFGTVVYGFESIEDLSKLLMFVRQHRLELDVVEMVDATGDDDE